VAWVGEILVSPRIAAKIATEHGLDPEEIVRLAQSPPPRIGRFLRDERGTRLYVLVRTAVGADVLVVLHSLGDDVWRLAGAHVQERKRKA
jgi:hypothetical protein